MKKTKLFIAVGMAIALGSGLTACTSPYNGQGTVVSKNIDAKETAGLTKETVITYKIIVDISDSETDRSFEVAKTQYDSMRVGEFIQIKEDKIR